MGTNFFKHWFGRNKDPRSPAIKSLFPLLRTFQPGDDFAEMIVHRPIGADLGAFLARVGPSPTGNIGISYVLKNQMADAPEKVINDMFVLAWENLSSDLRVRGGEAEKGVPLFTPYHPSNLVASAVGLPNFYERACSWLQSDEVFVAITDPNGLRVTKPNTRVAEVLREAIQRSDYWGAVALTPACYILRASGMERVAVRTAA